MTRDLANDAEYRKLDQLCARARGASKGHRVAAQARAKAQRTKTLMLELGMRPKGRRAC